MYFLIFKKENKIDTSIRIAYSILGIINLMTEMTHTKWIFDEIYFGEKIK